MIRAVLILTVLSLVSIPTHAEYNPWEGVEMATIKVNGDAYEFPVGGRERKDDIYYLKKGMNGDKEAMDMFLQGKDERMFFIGKDYPLWLKVTMDKMEVIKP